MSRHFTKALSSRAISVTSPLTDPPFTVAAWIKPASSSTMTIAGFCTDEASGSGYVIVGLLASGLPFMEAGTTNRPGNTPVALNVWTHITLVVDGTSVETVYVNGVLQADSGGITTPQPLTHISVGCLDLKIGGVVSFFDGDIDEIGVWDVPLNQAQITALQTSLPSAVVPANLRAYYDMDDASTTTETDKVGTYNLTLQNVSAGSTQAPVDVAAGVAPSNTAAPTITTDGTPQTGEVVSCSTGTWTGDATITYAYQWKRGASNIAGATANTYTLQVADVGQTIGCSVTATNASGNATQASGNTITPTAPPSGAPSNTAAPTISPTTGVETGDTLTVSAGTWTGSPTGYSFQLQRDTGSGFANVGSPVSDSDGSITYTPVAGDEGHPIRFAVTATNGSGSVTAQSNSVTPTAAPTSTANARLWVSVDGEWVSADPGGDSGEVEPTELRVINEASVRPEDFGEIGGADDAATIEACIFAATRAAMDNGSFYTEVRLDPTRVYNLTRNPTAGGSLSGIRRLGYSQIAMPEVVPETQNKLVLKLLGGGLASCMHWAQTTPMRHGSVLRSSRRVAPTSTDATHQEPNIIGCGPVQVGSNPLAPWFTNVHVLVEGLTIMGPVNLGMIAFDGRGLAELTVRDSQYMVDAYPGQLNSGSFPTDPAGVGWYYPIPGNNAVLDAEAVTAQGVTRGFVIAEHFTFDRLTTLHCRDAINVVQAYSAREATQHAMSGNRLCAEATYVLLRAVGNADQRFEVSIAMIDTEILGGVDNQFEDPTNILHGRVGVTNYAGDDPHEWTVNGARNLAIHDLSHKRGAFTMAAAGGAVKWWNERPASGATARKVFRDRKVYVTAGALTGLTIDGVSLGVRTEFEVPSGVAWSITYSSAPTLVQVIA